MRRLAILLVLALLGACANDDGEPGAEVTTTTSRSTTSTAPAAAEREQALATDEPCTRTTDGVPALVPLTVEGLAGMVLGREEVGGLVGWESDPTRHGYWGNEELQSMEVNPPSTCEDLERFGRILGFANAWTNAEDPRKQVTVSVHAFWDEAGAEQWVESYNAAMVPKRTAVEGLGAGAVHAVHEGPDGTREWVMLRRGSVVGWVTTLDHDLDHVAVARRLAERIEEPVPVGGAIDAAGLLSAPLPRISYGERGEGLRWDFFFGGCADTEERASIVGEEDAGRSADFGRITGCTAMYSPPEGTDTSVVRVFSAVQVYRDAEGAAADLGDGADRYVGRGGTRFDPGTPGDDAYGMVLSTGGDTRSTQTRVAFRIGRLTGTVAVDDQDDADATGEVRALAVELAARIERMLER